ncbi:aliphatic sulfonates ABC transporter, periplasmic substrate-binding protein [Geotalea daltonii FRC-32]|uniref:Putative aliphatic sulfonates-binding protein n=1 Tax=Geotalea daltonii (strain DSM 22248 / JCM 15807 / FRC-32) TaxID=316067 RepID=B9M636_GEODF|nr:aliphatic sulfonate ABC transporter substrate-binding protein [Geotalea daltonii]ACM20017.1 aliphatic sulfonates ABC transporter, periplasmic substrate-binding protein [Geotalea daltonii FRC-32]
MKKVFSTLLGILTIAVMTTGPAAAGELRIATQPIPQYAPIFIAKHKKWVEEELAKVGAKPAIKWSSFSAGPPINESFAAGQQDVGFLGDTPAIIGKSAGIDTRIIGLTSTGPKALAVVVPRKSTIKSARDLKGKKVAVVKGSYAHHLLVLVLQKGGLTINDIELINLSQADSTTALLSGNIDAAAIWEPVITKLESQGAVRVLADGSGIKKGLLVIIATDNLVSKNREQVKALLKAYQRGAKFIKTNPREAARLIANDVNLTPELLLKVFPRFDFNPAIQADDIDEIKKTEAFMRNAGLIKSSVNIGNFVDLSLTRESGIR